MTNIVVASGETIFTGLYDLLIEFCAPVVVVFCVYWGVRVIVLAFRSALGR